MVTNVHSLIRRKPCGRQQLARLLIAVSAVLPAARTDPPGRVGQMDITGPESAHPEDAIRVFQALGAGM